MRRKLVDPKEFEALVLTFEEHVDEILQESHLLSAEADSIIKGKMKSASWADDNERARKCRQMIIDRLVDDSHPGLNRLTELKRTHEKLKTQEPRALEMLAECEKKA